MKSNKLVVQLGDVFAVKLPNGKFGAIRIVNQEGRSRLIAVTTYMDSNIPAISDPQLLSILLQNRFRYENESALSWYDGNIPKDILYIGNIPITDQEKILQCNKYSGAWSSTCAIPVYSEWRWLNDRENFEKEIIMERAKREEANRQRSHAPKQMMNEDEFWAFISMLDLQQAEEEQAVLPLVIKLAKTSVKSIKEFEETLSFKLYVMDTREHAKHIGEFSYDEAEDYVSADGFLYARCAAVAKGKALYELALKFPTNMPKDETFEMLLAVARDAYHKRTGKEFEYVPGCSYESFENKEGWK